ncbi:MAG: Tad domain-containing protein [Anaerolineales bacterium]|nr:Tad domain-containing protein [Anaerolineales bacterium]
MDTVQAGAEAAHLHEKGQSIVLIALALVGLLAFVGIAVDVGFVFARSTQLQSAVDSAALAAVSELVADPSPGGPGEAAANQRATQFFQTNGFDIIVDVTGGSSNQFGTGDSLGIQALGSIEYELIADWPVELFFLRLIGRDSITLTRSAVSAIFPMADIYASRRVEDGILSTSNQAVFGPMSCTSMGDPFSPISAGGPHTYEYRILIPAGYEQQHSYIRVELFDPDSINAAANSATVIHTNLAVSLGDPATENLNCPNNSRYEPCLINTGEANLGGVTLDDINPYWFLRIDENRYGNGSTSCGNSGSYVATNNTETEYELFYWRQNPDGTLIRVPLAKYTGQAGDGVRDTGNHQTDLRWVSPGAPPIYDQPAPVPTDCNESPNGGDYDPVSCPSGSAAGPGTGFEVDIATDLVDILTDPATGNRYLYLNVTSVTGSSENGYEIWAGPNTYISNISSDANLRNLQILNNRGAHTSKGITVFGMGNLPMNSNTNARVEIPLIWVGPEQAGNNVYISTFDSDSGASPPVIFYFDSIAQSDYSISYTSQGGRCAPGSCNNRWVNPAYEIKVPGDTANCDYLNPNPADCTPFYGGRLIASYQGGFADTYGWQARLSGQPYLVR